MPHYELNAPKVIQESFGDEIVAIDFDNGSYFSMRGSASEIWRLLIEGHTSEAIDAALAQRFGAEAAGACEQTLQQLLKSGLIRPAMHARAANAPSIAAARFEAPLIEKYDDMNELLLLDPIHEVDAQGWPKPAP